jgi:anti-sigma-K factor RsiG
MKAFPDLGRAKDLSDDELRDLIDRLVKEEHEVSYRRRILHGQIDILKAELQRRLQEQVGGEEGPLYEVDVDKLAAILAGRAAPPNPSD